MAGSITRAVLGAARSDRMRDLVTKVPVSRNLARRFVAGPDPADALRVAGELLDGGLTVTVEPLRDEVGDRGQAGVMADRYVALLGELGRAGWGTAAEVSLTLSAIGARLNSDGPAVALDHARRICAAAADAGTTVTVNMEDPTTTDLTLQAVRSLREDFPQTGAVLQASLRRTEADCRELSGQGSRVRLCKGAYAGPEGVAFQTAREIDRSYVRCLKILLAGHGYPMIATHDPRLVEIAASLAARYRREQGSYEFQMLYGVRPGEQRRLVRAGERVRVYLPYGRQWYGYLARRLAERPANLGLFLRSMVSKR